MNWDLSRLLREAPPYLMGVLNITPDSFSDGGRFVHDSRVDAQAATSAALQMLADGAAIIDIGAESTRPGAAAVDAAEQISRLLPTISELVQARPNVTISVDTTQSEVARAALGAGASIINDVSAGRDDPRMFEVAATSGCGLILMHRVCAPSGDSYSDSYKLAPIAGDVVEVVLQFLSQRVDAAVRAGVLRHSLAIDPGLGFGKTVEQNFQLMARLGELGALGLPLVVGVSRKSFLGAVCGEADPKMRDLASVIAALECVRRGASLIRAHAIAAHVQAFRVGAALL